MIVQNVINRERDKILRDTINKVIQLKIDLQLNLIRYSDTDRDIIEALLRLCDNSTDYLLAEDFDKAKSELCKIIQTFKFNTKDVGFEEILNYHRTKWYIEILGLIVAIDFLKPKDINKELEREIREHMLCDEYNKIYNKGIVLSEGELIDGNNKSDNK